MRRNTRGDKERSKEQELKYENNTLRKELGAKDRELNSLKREVSSLRRQLAKVDLSRYNDLKVILEEHAENENSQEAEVVLGQLEKHWRCYDCAEGVLEIVVYSKAGTEWYFRQCNCCPNKRTKAQIYHPNVKGIYKLKPA